MGCPFYRSKGSFFWNRLTSLFKKKSNTLPLSVENLQAILDNTFDAIVTINTESRIIAFNKAAEHMFGYTKEEALGEPVTILMPEPYHSAHNTYVENYLKTGVKKILGFGREVIAKRKDATEFPIHLAVEEVVTKNGRLFTGVIRDITLQKESEKAQQENMRIAAELKVQNEFIAILSHELRSPLTAIRGALALLLPEQNLSEKCRELITIAYRQVMRLGILIGNILELQKVQHGLLQVELHAVSIKDVVQEAIVSMEVAARAKEVVVRNQSANVEVRVYADYDKLLQVLNNLLSNAIKFSPPKAEVVISIEIVGDHVRVSVHDHGPGFPKKFASKIFTAFAQAETGDNRSKEGAGLGLAICKSIIEKFQGIIGYYIDANQGTTFYFELKRISNE